MNAKTLRSILSKLNACNDAMIWTRGKTLKQAWECKRGDWLLWLLEEANIDDSTLIRVLCDCAEQAAPQWDEDTEMACMWAIDAARRWTRGDSTRDELKAANEATYLAYVAKWENRDFSLERAASYAAQAANWTVTYAAGLGANVYEVAEHVVGSVVDVNFCWGAGSLRAKSLAKTADIVRQHVSLSDIEKALVLANR